MILEGAYRSVASLVELRILPAPLFIRWPPCSSSDASVCDFRRSIWVWAARGRYRPVCWADRSDQAAGRDEVNCLNSRLFHDLRCGPFASISLYPSTPESAAPSAADLDVLRWPGHCSHEDHRGDRCRRHIAAGASRSLASPSSSVSRCIYSTQTSRFRTPGCASVVGSYRVPSGS